MATPDPELRALIEATGLSYPRLAERAEGKVMETFEIFGTEWDVSLAKRLAEGKPVRKFRVADWAGMARLVKTWPEKVVIADLSQPIITMRVESGYFPIDGWHRINRALDDGVEFLPEVRLSAKERNLMRIQRL
jgi:hypothetical protein